MANRKLTDLLPSANSTDSNDLFYFVDVSDNTESPEGTSKSIEKKDFVPEITQVSIQGASTVSSNVLGGTEQQPNITGKEVHLQYFISDGINNTFNVTSPFIINNLTRINIRGNVLRKSDGALTTYNTTNSLVVNSGYGTNTVNVTIPLADLGDLIEFTVYGENDEPTSNCFLNTTLGYDNLSNTIMTNLLGAHGITPSGLGHNTILGGSFSRIWGSFCSLHGKGIFIGRNENNSFGCFGFGQGMEIDGTYAMGLGSNLEIQGTSVFHFGRDSKIDNVDDVYSFGRKSLAESSNEMIFSGGSSTDSENGLYQRREILLKENTTNSTIQIMNLPVGSSSIFMPEDSSSLLNVYICGVSDDFTKHQIFSGQFIASKTGGVARIDNSSGDVNVPSIKSIGSPSGWATSVRGLAGSLVVRVTGELATNIRWICKLELIQTKF